MLAVATTNALRVYNAISEKLVWELYGSSPSIVRLDESPAVFTNFMRPSPDGGVICAEVQRGALNELLVIETSDGRVRTKRKPNSYDGSVTSTSFDNNHVGLFAWRPSCIKLHAVGVGKIEDGSFYTIPFQSPEWGLRYFAMSFTPDNEHILTCEGPMIGPNTTDFSIKVRVFRHKGGRLTDEHSFSSSRTRPNLLQTERQFFASFHFPSEDQWLVCFPDFDDTSNVCIVNARSGTVLARVSAGLSYVQQLQAGIVPTKAAIQVALDVETGMWTRMQQNMTLIPGRRTVTIMRFAIPGLQMKWEKSSNPVQFGSIIINIEPGDRCHLSSNGLFLTIQHGPNGKIDVMSLS